MFCLEVDESINSYWIYPLSPGCGSVCCWINVTLVLIEVAMLVLCCLPQDFSDGTVLIVHELICLCSYESGISPLLDFGVLRSLVHQIQAATFEDIVYIPILEDSENIEML